MNKIKVIGSFVLILFLAIQPLAAQNLSNIITGPAGEEIEGDPDQPIITGRIVNPSETPAPEPTGIEHEDIGIAEPEPTLMPEPTGIDDDEFGKTLTQGSSTPAPGAPEIDDEVIVAFESGEPEGEGFNEIRMDDTKGNEESQGEVRFGDGIRGSRPAEEGESYKVEVRGWDVKDKEAVQAQYQQTDRDFILERAARDVGELEEYSKALTQSDPNIQQIILTESTVAFDYKYPAKLFGIINIDYTARAEVDELGRIKTKFPWWLFLTKNNADDISAELENQLANSGDDAQLANIDLQNSVQKQQQTLQTMSNVSKALHDIAMKSIRNTRA
jgi:hypothetical protein